jgi:cytochrome P450
MLAHVSSHLSCLQETAYQEQESIFQGSDRSVTMKDLNEMKYLERVIKETLRLYPSVPIIGRILKKDVNIGNLQLGSIPSIIPSFLDSWFLRRLL